MVMAADIELRDLPFRPKKSAHGYAKIWLDEGSPLALYTERLSQALADKLHGITVRHAMTYGKPAVSDVLSELKRRAWEEFWRYRFIRNMLHPVRGRLWTKYSPHWRNNATR